MKLGWRSLPQAVWPPTCRLGAWRLRSMEMVGRDPVPGLSWEGKALMPSDHFGLLLRLEGATGGGGGS